MANTKRFKELIDVFEDMFPDWAGHVVEYKPFQRDVIILILEGGRSLVFFHKGDDNWSFGTKLYRPKPRKTIEKIEKEENNNEESKE